MKALVNWLDSRTGVRGFVHEALYERIPGGARWRYVWGSTLVFAFTVQAITGLVLWMFYSPSAQTAWESVYFIQHEAFGGWLLRGLHHFMAQAMVVLLAVHLLQVVIDGAYRAPREVNFWLGLVLMQIVLALSLTGYLLPWDQKGYWATRVATNLLGVVPLVGTSLQQIVVGGADYGHHTLTRFFALHAGVLPALLVLFLVVHVALFRRHGICHKQPARAADTTFWPDQVLKDAVACLAVLAVVLVLCLRPGGLFTGAGLSAGPHGGAELGAPADPANPYSAARPEWYFLFLFQFLKLFEGWGETGEILGAIVIPSLVLAALFLMPIVGRWNLGHRFNVLLLLALFCGIGYLTMTAVHEDYQARWTDAQQFAELQPLVAQLGADDAKIAAHFEDDPRKIADYHRRLGAYARYRKSQEYLEAVEAARADAERVITLAAGPRRIPVAGAVTLLRNDPKTQGAKLFARHCAGCHTHLAPDTSAEALAAAAEKATAPNLFGFGGRAWLAGLLSDKITGPQYFGNTAHAEGEMAGFVNDTMSDWPREDVDKVVAALSAEAHLPAQTEIDRRDAAAIEAGRTLIGNEENCAGCHKFRDAGTLGAAPDLTGYGSRPWLIEMIGNPAGERFYPDTNDRMPAFAENPHDAAANILSSEAVGLIADWLRGAWYEPGVEPAAKSPSGGTPSPTDNAAEPPSVPAEEEAPPDAPKRAAGAEEPAAPEPTDERPPVEPAADPENPAAPPPSEAPAEPAGEPESPQPSGASMSL